MDFLKVKRVLCLYKEGLGWVLKVFLFLVMKVRLIFFIEIYLLELECKFCGVEFI